MPTFKNIGLQEPSTVTGRVAAVEIARGSTNELQEILCLGDPNSSIAIQAVVAQAPQSTHFGAVVRIASGPSSAVDLQVRPVFSSTSTDNPVSAAQAGTWNIGTVSSVAGVVAVNDNGGSLTVDGTVSVSGYSTTVNVSSLAGRLAIAGFHAISGVVNVTDSTNNAINVNVVAGAAAGSTITTISRILGNSSAADYNPVRLVDSSGTGYHGPTNPMPVSLTDSSNAVVKVADSANNAVRVNIVAGSAVDYQHGSSMTASTVTGPAVLLRASAAAPSAVSGDDQFVLQWALRNGQAVATLASSGGTLIDVSTSAPSSNTAGLIVRPVVSGMQTYAASTTGQSSATTIVSSNAGSKVFVYAYTITSTIAGSSPQCGFYDGATLKWPVYLSSGFAGANLAVSPPAYLFATSTGSPFTFNVATSNAGMTVGIAYWVST